MKQFYSDVQFNYTATFMLPSVQYDSLTIKPTASGNQTLYLMSATGEAVGGKGWRIRSSATDAVTGVVAIENWNGSGWGLAFQLSSSSLVVNGSTVWTQGNDGVGSGLDADLLGGIATANYARKDTTNTFTLAQTFSVAPVFTDQSGTRTALGIPSAAYTWTAAHIFQAGATGIVRIHNTTSGMTTIGQTSGGLLLTAAAHNITTPLKYSPGVFWGSTDPQLTTTTPKIGAGVVGYATESYTLDTHGGMGIEFFGQINTPGVGPTDLVSLGTATTGGWTIALATGATAVTQTAGDNDTSVATTAFVATAVSAIAPGGSGVALGRSTTEYRVCEDMERGFQSSGATGTSYLTSSGVPTVYTNGGTGTLLSGESGHPGILQISSAASASGSPRLVPWNRNGIVVGGGELQFDTCIRIPTLSVAAQRFEIRLGFMNAITGADRLINCYYKDDVNSGFWRLVTQNSGGTTNTDTATTGPTANTWHHIRIVVNAGATSVSLYVDNMTTPVATATTNIPNTTTDVLAAVNGLSKTVGTTARVLDTDYIELYQVFTTTR